MFIASLAAEDRQCLLIRRIVFLKVRHKRGVSHALDDDATECERSEVISSDPGIMIRVPLRSYICVYLLDPAASALYAAIAITNSSSFVLLLAALFHPVSASSAPSHLIAAAVTALTTARAQGLRIVEFMRLEDGLLSKWPHHKGSQSKSNRLCEKLISEFLHVGFSHSRLAMISAEGAASS